MAASLEPLKTSLIEDIRLQLEAVFQSRQAAAGGSAQAASVLPAMQQNLKETSDLFAALNVLLHDGNKAQQDKAKLEKSLLDRYRQGTEAATSSVWGFTRAMIGIYSVQSMVRQSVSTPGAQGGPLSTLEKSWQLLLMQFGKTLVPVIVDVAGRLQDMARAVGASRGFVDGFGRALEASRIPILKQSGQGWQKIDWYFGGGKEEAGDITRRNAAATVSAAAAGYKRMGPREKALYREHGGQEMDIKDDPQGRINATPLETDEGFDRYIQARQKARADRRYREAKAADEAEAKARASAGGAFVAGFGGGGGLAGGLQAVLGTGTDAGGRRAAFETGGWPEGGPRRWPEGGPRRPGTPGILSDVKPAGYTAGYSEVGNIREQMQAAAFNLTQLDLKLLEEGNKIAQAMLKELQEQNDRRAHPEKPPR